MAKAKTPVVSLGGFDALPLPLQRSMSELYTTGRTVKTAEASSERRRTHIKTELLRGAGDGLGTLVDPDRGIRASVVHVLDATTTSTPIADLRAALVEAGVDFEPYTSPTYTLEPVDHGGSRLPAVTADPIDGRRSLAGIALEAKHWADLAAYNARLRDSARINVISALRAIGKLPESSTVYVFDAASGAFGGLRITVGNTLDVEAIRVEHPTIAAAVTTTRPRAGYLRLDIARITGADATAMAASQVEQ